MLMSRELATQLLRKKGTKYRDVFETDLFGGKKYYEYTVAEDNDYVTIDSFEIENPDIEIFYKGSYRKVEKAN